MSVEQKLSKACEIAKSAGKISLQYFRQPVDIENKLSDGQFDPVTQADKEVEAYIRDALASAYPEDGILGEEQAEKIGTSEYRWVIDPIDGTRAFMTGIPLWGILVGLQKSGVTVAGLMYQPFTDELFFGSDKQAMVLTKGKRSSLKTSDKSSLDEVSLYTTTPDTFEPHLGAWGKFETLSEKVRLTRFGGDCYTYCLLAMGQIDIVIDGSLQTYDIVPLIPIIEAAGGIVTNWEGKDASNGGLIIAAANKSLHTQAMEVLNKAKTIP